MAHQSEFDRIWAAHREAEKLVDQLPPEVVEKAGRCQLLSDLSYQLLMSGRPSQELADQLKSQISNERAEDPKDSFK
jgi:hypothetical protein